MEHVHRCYNILWYFILLLEVLCRNSLLNAVQFIAMYPAVHSLQQLGAVACSYISQTLHNKYKKYPVDYRIQLWPHGTDAVGISGVQSVA